MLEVFLEKRVLRWPPLEAFMEFFPKEHRCFVNEVAINFVHPWLFVSSI